MINLQNITVKYEGATVMENFSLCLPDSGTVAILSPSGSGKTTLLRLLSGLIKPLSGSVSGLDGKRICFVFQEDRLVLGLSAEENVCLPLPKESFPLAGQFLGELGLAGWEGALPKELSGGMKRRVAIARAFAYGSTGCIYLLDEPFRGLDEAATAQVMDFIRRHSCGALTVLVTHNRLEAVALADEIITLTGSPFRVVSTGRKDPPAPRARGDFYF